MGFNNKSDYALNKTSKCIVYRFATTENDGSGKQEVRCLTADDMENFEFWKRLSDSDYHNIEKNEKRTSHRDVSIHAFEESDKCATNSLEDEYCRQIDEQEDQDIRTLENGLSIMERCLTPTQYRRFYQYYYIGMTTRQIADAEQKTQMTIFESLKAAEKKIKKILEKG